MTDPNPSANSAAADAIDPGQPPSQPTLADLYQWWWLHDAQWYQGVLRRFGPEAANEINAEALRFVAQRVARAVAKKLRAPVAELDWDEVVAAFGACPDQMWPAGLVEYTYQVTAPGEFEVTIEKSFTFSMLRRAGSLQTYECPCLDMRAGWFEGLGLQPERNEITRCILKGARNCHLVARVSGYAEGTDQVPSDEAAG